MLHGRMRSAATVVDRVSFDVHVGEIFGVLGPNGAGKTTTLKVLAVLFAVSAFGFTIRTGHLGAKLVWEDPQELTESSK